jgi:hypothetical protein
MTDTETQIAIAEACGWAYDEHHSRPFWDNGRERYWDAEQLAERYNSLDTLQSAVLAQDEQFQREFGLNLLRKMSEVIPTKYYHQLSVRDWQQVFVETLKQLEDYD